MTALAHAMRNVLAALGFAVEALHEASGGAPAAQQPLVSAQRGLQRALRLIAAAADLAQASQAPKGAAAATVAKAVQGACQRLTPALQADAVELKVKVPQALCLALPDGALTQILQALLANACEAVHGAPEPRRIVVRAVAGAAGDALVTVGDSGPGIAADVRTRLFAPFVTTRAPAHSGMGLTIARRLAERHGGSLELGDGAGGGALAELRLPSA